MLVHKYELFKMKSNESIPGMFTRFTDIINNLKNLGRAYTNAELCRKILWSLSHSWKAKVTAIQEAKDMSTLKLEELLGSLMTHELKLNQLNEDEDEIKKKRPIALPTMIPGESDENSEKNVEISLLARKIRNFMKKKKLLS